MRRSKELCSIKKVQESIGELIPKGKVSLVQTAEELGISPRSLQRRLAEQGMNYSLLLDEMRFLKAKELIQEQEKLKEVADRLGYSDAGSFTRAFERWSGMSPLQFRKKNY